MEKTFKHPQIFADMLVFCQIYYALHINMPKPFRFAVGEHILAELTQCLRFIVLANAVDKVHGRAEGARHLHQVRASLEVVRGFLLLAWKLKFISHGALVELSPRLEAMSKQAARWAQWFELT